MEKFIYTYLSENYYIQTSDVGNQGIYQRYDDLRIPIPFNGDRLVKDITTVFGVTKVEAKGYISGWAQVVEPNINLDFYWKIAEVFGNLVFPVIQNIAASTISRDLISVQSMSAPTGELYYIDYVYSNKNIFEKVIKFLQNIYKRIFGIFKN
jgi:hypothetical protein